MPHFHDETGAVLSKIKLYPQAAGKVIPHPATDMMVLLTTSSTEADVGSCESGNTDAGTAG